MQSKNYLQVFKPDIQDRLSRYKTKSFKSVQAHEVLNYCQNNDLGIIPYKMNEVNKTSIH
jgi:hypothetical protein